jgi:integrase
MLLNLSIALKYNDVKCTSCLKQICTYSLNTLKIVLIIPCSTLGQIYVNRSMQYIRGDDKKNRIIFREPKTAKSRRLIALSPSTVIALREHKAKDSDLRQSLGYAPPSDDDLVFSHYDGSPLLPNSVTHAWIKLVRRCGLHGIRLHDTRHTHPHCC